MDYQRLFQRLERETRQGDPPMTARDVATKFSCSESHARGVLGWMTSQNPPMMREVSGTKPKQWSRI